MRINHESTTTPVPEVIVLGGTTTTKQHVLAYKRVLDVPSPNGIPAEDRFFPLLDKGYGRAADTLADMEERVSAFAADLDTPPILVGHSQGGLYAAELGLNRERPIASAVISLAGLQMGLDKNDPRSDALRVLFRSPAVEEDVAIGSEFIENHLDSLATNWSGVPFLNVAATVDHIVPNYAQFTPQLPAHMEQVRNYVDVSKYVRGMARTAMARIHGWPEDVQYTESLYGSEHLTLLFSKGVKNLIRQTQLEVAAASQLTELESDLTDMPELQSV